MKYDEIIDVLDKRFKKIKKHYNNVLEDFSPQEIHDFRLEVKRLRAFIRMVNTDIQRKKLGMGNILKAFIMSLVISVTFSSRSREFASIVMILKLKSPSCI